MSNEVDFNPYHERAMAGFDELDRLMAMDRPKIKEQLFKEFFLPVLTSSDPKIRMDYWLEHVAKSPNSPVDVLDDVTGAVLFTVPPLFAAVNYRRNRSDQSLESLITVAKLKERDFPMAAKRFMVDAIQEGIVSSGVTPEQQSWLVILQRYGLVESVMGFETDLPGISKVDNTPVSDDPFAGGFDEL